MSHVAGYCGNTKGDIQSPPSPTCRSFFGSPASPEMPSSLRECALRCKECDACTIVSYSKQTGDCTLYGRCNMSSVSKGYGYTTRAIRQAAGDEAVVPAETDDPPSCSFSCNAQRPCPLRERRCGSFSMHSATLHEHLSSWMRGKHIVFVGSSVTRYQYLNLAYHLLHGRPPPFDLTDYSYELRRATGVSAPTKTGDYEGYWSGYYNATVRALNMPAEHGRHDPANKERCDCYRGRPESSHMGDDKWRGLGFRESEMHNIDMRYTRTGARHGHAALTYAQWFMDTVPFRGHWFREFYTSGVEHARGSSPRTSTEDCKPGTCGPPYDFEFGGVSGPELEYRLKAAAKTGQVGSARRGVGRTWRAWFRRGRRGGQGRCTRHGRSRVRRRSARVLRAAPRARAQRAIQAASSADTLRSGRPLARRSEWGHVDGECACGESPRRRRRDHMCRMPRGRRGASVCVEVRHADRAVQPSRQHVRSRQRWQGAVSSEAREGSLEMARL